MVTSCILSIGLPVSLPALATDMCTLLQSFCKIDMGLTEISWVCGPRVSHRAL